MQLPRQEDVAFAAGRAQMHPTRFAARRRIRGMALRQLTDALVCLMVAVVLLRSFHLEGYMISTGSMASTLLGYHKRVVCPECEHHFAVGVQPDELDLEDPIEYESPQPRHMPHAVVPGHSGEDPHPAAVSGGETATCPNCGRRGISLADIPRNHGDQLLVHKHAYSLITPKRWDVVVFRNPGRPTQAYVKRAVGLPGETVQIIDGDVYADGRICRKPFPLQRSMRILVHDARFEPRASLDWQPRWTPVAAGAGWTVGSDAIEFAPEANSTIPSGWSWLRYRHWIRDGGDHTTSISLDSESAKGKLPNLTESQVRYDARRGLLSCVGTLSATARDRLIAATADENCRRAMEDLYRQSHVAPVADAVGYNAIGYQHTWTPVRDLMLSVEVHASEARGQFAAQLTDGAHVYTCRLDLATGEATLDVDDESNIVARGQFTAPKSGEPLSLEMSLFDRQVLAAVNGREVFSGWPIPEESAKAEPPRIPARIGVRDGRITVSALRLFRDVYYTQKGMNLPCRMKDDEYFVLGDNSPVSVDSRSWSKPTVERRLFLGKPLVVHLPSRPGELRVAGHTKRVRIPDWERIRYIR